MHVETVRDSRRPSSVAGRAGNRNDADRDAGREDDAERPAPVSYSDSSGNYFGIRAAPVRV